jgi:beta-aspartyl-peptidase (threonine type)
MTPTWQRATWALIGVSLLAGCAAAASGPAPDAASPPVAIALHGGAGTMTRDQLTDVQEAAIRGKLTEALETGHEVLIAGGTSLDAVQAAIVVLEQSPLFNAGVGAVYTWDAGHELDASIMDGATRNAGAVAGVRLIKSPVIAARAVMDRSEHVMLSGAGAEAFAQSQGLAMVPNSHFDTPGRRASLDKVKAQLLEDEQARLSLAPEHRFGTVGAVALDAAGNLAAATSTGGMTAKRWGRIGDSPVIGAGTWADNRSCAVSATGHGEYFIRYHVAADICARVRYQGQTVAAAGQAVLFDELLPAGGTGGVIILGPDGDIAMPFNTEGMYRAAIDITGRKTVRIYRDQAPGPSDPQSP